MRTFQTSFFDESKRLAGLSRLRDPLEELSKHIDFNMFRSILTEALRKAERKSPDGRKPLDVILMFKALIIQRLFNLSDEQLEYLSEIRLRTFFCSLLEVGAILLVFTGENILRLR